MIGSPHQLSVDLEQASNKNGSFKKGEWMKKIGDLSELSKNCENGRSLMLPTKLHLQSAVPSDS